MTDDFHERADTLAADIEATISDTRAVLDSLPEFEDRPEKRRERLAKNNLVLVP